MGANTPDRDLEIAKELINLLNSLGRITLYLAEEEREIEQNPQKYEPSDLDIINETKKAIKKALQSVADAIKDDEDEDI